MVTTADQGARVQPDEDFWDDLLAHLRERVLVPVVGPELITVKDGERTLQLTHLIGERLAARYKLPVQGSPGLHAAVQAYLAARGRDQDERLYRVVNDILAEIAPQPCDALRQLAAITDFDLFLSTTFDDLLARALDEVHYGGQAGTARHSFSPAQSTDAQESSARAPAVGHAVFKLFGAASSLPQYALHEEDTLEWLHALLSDTAHLPDWVDHPLKERPLLLLGCRIPDWVGRYLLRLASTTRLSQVKKQFFIVSRDIGRHPDLSAFFGTYCGGANVLMAEQDPAEFVAELHARWRKRQPADAGAQAAAPAPAAPGSIFISYVREDAEAAARLADAIGALGGDVWLDQRRLQPGDRWEAEILGSIRRGIRLFVPVISRQTESREEGYVFKEWAEAVERARGIPGRRFIVPVVIDENYDGNPARYRMTPEPFRQFHFGTAPGGQPDAALRTVLTEEIRAMRRAGQA